MKNSIFYVSLFTLSLQSQTFKPTIDSLFTINRSVLLRQNSISYVPQRWHFGVIFPNNFILAYNSNSGLTDRFYLKNQKVIFSNSFYNPQNLLGKNGIKVDSFNPYGTDNAGASLALGAITMLINQFKLN